MNKKLDNEVDVVKILMDYPDISVEEEKKKMLKDYVDSLKKDDSNAIEFVNHPNHYNNYDMEVIDMMEAIWGTQKVIDWCIITAFKYRMRMGTKPGESVERDLEKEKWYFNKANELKHKLDMNKIVSK